MKLNKLYKAMVSTAVLTASVMGTGTVFAAEASADLTVSLNVAPVVQVYIKDNITPSTPIQPSELYYNAGGYNIGSTSMCVFSNTNDAMKLSLSTPNNDFKLKNQDIDSSAKIVYKVVLQSADQGLTRFGNADTREFGSDNLSASITTNSLNLVGVAPCGKTLSKDNVNISVVTEGIDDGGVGNTLAKGAYRDVITIKLEPAFVTE